MSGRARVRELTLDALRRAGDRGLTTAELMDLGVGSPSYAIGTVRKAGHTVTVEAEDMGGPFHVTHNRYRLETDVTPPLFTGERA